MKKFQWLCVLTVFLLGVAAVGARQPEGTPVITLERQPCFGFCPMYTVSIFEDGTVVYNGDSNVDVTGEQTSEIAPETVQQMVDAFASAGYFEWEEAYTTQTVTDLPTVITSVTRDGETHRIQRYAGDNTAPLALPFLENWIDLMASTGMWTGAQIDPSAISNGTDTAVITLQRDPCFGMCPVYSVAAFADGTVVYTGIANVDKIGVHVFEADPAAVNSAAQLADILGYFEWQPAYDQQVRTDQPTVTTSFRWEDQSQKIVRYEGDPNAPVGLLWLEASIDQLVTDISR